MRIKVLYEWLLQSNRLSHVKAGVIIFLMMIIFCFFLLSISLGESATVSLMTTAIAAMAVDYKDKLWGGKFDWLDVASTILIPGLITLISITID